MYAVFVKLLNMSIAAGILALAIMLLRLCLKKAPKKYICILWAFVALRLLCPIGFTSSLSVFNLLHTGTESGQVQYFAYNGKSEKPELLFDVPALVDDNESTDSMTVGTHTSDLYLPVAMCIWLCGVSLMLATALISYVRLKEKVSVSIPWKETVQTVQTQNIYVCDEISSPFILGVVKPRIYLPSGMTEETQKHVIAHESTHLQRHDHWWKPMGYILLSIYWFNPVLWIAYILLCRDIEAACDEKVIMDMDKENIVGYSEALLACALRRKMITACPVAFGETNVKGRVKHVLNYKKPAICLVALSVLVCVVVAVCFLTNPKQRTTVPDDSQGDGVYSNESKENEDPFVVNTYEETDPNLVDEYWDNDKLVTQVKYYEMSDGTWKTDEYTYQYRLEITGRMGGGAVKDSTFVYLSNIENISFDQAWKAAGFSSNMNDYFDEKDAKLVAIK
ncbi:MAG: M56 family metallopeptidase [Lachnospiraceae bacterium]|nr:M56 family metallopeptidase [Lachnospiraceae bacterium]